MNMKNARFYYSAPMYTVKVAVIGANGFNPDNVIGYYGNTVEQMPRITICSILSDDKTHLSFGVAMCSKKDRFVKKIGRELAYNRALNSPIATVKVTKDNISDVRMETCAFLEDQVRKMNPKLF